MNRDNAPNKGYIACVLWGKQSVPSVRRRCCMCEKTLALDETNVAATKDFRFLCLPCSQEFLTEHPEEEFGGVMIAGKTYIDPKEAILAALGVKNRN